MTVPNVRRRLAAILAADVAGFSRLMSDDEEGALSRLQEHEREIVAPHLADHSGHIFKNTGDGFLAEFASVVDAVRCALEIQEDLADRNRQVEPHEVLQFRMGINVGDVIVGERDFHGEGVNLAARLQTLAEPGGVCVSAKVYDEVAGKIDARFEDLGERKVKNFERPIHVYSVRPGPAIPLLPARPRVVRPLALAVVAGFFVLLAVIGWTSLKAPPPPQTATTEIPAGAPRLSMAVLPFVNLSGDAAQDYLADSLTEDLTTDLSRIPGSFVISRSTSATYKGTGVDVRQVGRELGVRYMLEGSVRARDGAMRVTAQLIDVESGAHLWSERFERTRAEWPAVEDEIIGQIARIVDLEVVAAESRRSLRERAVDPDASDLAMRGWGLMNLPQVRDTNAEALALFESALKRDERAVEALVGLAFAHMRNVLNRWSAEPGPEQQAAEDAISRALVLDPRHATAHMVQGIIFRAQKRFDQAIASFRTALANNPNLAPAYAQLGAVLVYQGQTGASLEQYEKAIRLSPRDPNLGIWLMLIGWSHLLLGHDAEALDWLQRAATANPGFGVTQAMLAIAYSLNGRPAEAQQAMAQLRRLIPNTPIARMLLDEPSENPVFKAQLARLSDAIKKAALDG